MVPIMTSGLYAPEEIVYINFAAAGLVKAEPRGTIEKSLLTHLNHWVEIISRNTV